jgi:hypothetical protein
MSPFVQFPCLPLLFLEFVDNLWAQFLDSALQFCAHCQANHRIGYFDEVIIDLVVGSRFGGDHDHCLEI